MDYKTEMLMRDNAQTMSSKIGWIYIGADIDKKDFAKVGMTKGTLNSRATSSQAPGYVIFKAFKVHERSNDSIPGIENRVKKLVEKEFWVKDHFGSGHVSECFEVNPHELSNMVEEILLEEFSSDFVTFFHDDSGEYRLGGFVTSSEIEAHFNENHPFDVHLENYAPGDKELRQFEVTDMINKPLPYRGCGLSDNAFSDADGIDF